MVPRVMVSRCKKCHLLSKKDAKCSDVLFDLCPYCGGELHILDIKVGEITPKDQIFMSATKVYFKSKEILEKLKNRNMSSQNIREYNEEQPIELFQRSKKQQQALMIFLDSLENKLLINPLPSLHLGIISIKRNESLRYFQKNSMGVQNISTLCVFDRVYLQKNLHNPTLVSRCTIVDDYQGVAIGSDLTLENVAELERYLNNKKIIFILLRFENLWMEFKEKLFEILKDKKIFSIIVATPPFGNQGQEMLKDIKRSFEKLDHNHSLVFMLSYDLLKEIKPLGIGVRDFCQVFEKIELEALKELSHLDPQVFDTHPFKSIWDCLKSWREKYEGVVKYEDLQEVIK